MCVCLLHALFLLCCVSLCVSRFGAHVCVFVVDYVLHALFDCDCFPVVCFVLVSCVLSVVCYCVCLCLLSSVVIMLCIIVSCVC